ncbi:hypothetical protein GCM10029992_15750 [Glycomyces albus]
MVVRIPFGGGIGAVEHHSESPESYFVHTAGLKVVTCSNPNDAHWMIQQAAAGDDPVVFLEPKRRYQAKGEVDTEQAALGLHQAAVVRPGSTATLIAYGPTVDVALASAEAGVEEGYDLEVIDLRSLSPIDWEPLRASLRKTGRAVVVHEAPRTLGMGAEVAASLSEECFYSLEAPVLRVAGYDVPYPASRLEDDYLPNLDRVLDAVDRSLEH